MSITLANLGSHKEESACQSQKAGARSWWFFECKFTNFFLYLQEKRSFFSFAQECASVVPMPRKSYSHSNICKM